jgi:hypothetical protein
VPLDPSIAPGGILFRHLDHELFDRLNDTRSPERSAMRAPVEFLRHEAGIPAYERIGRGNRGDLFQARATEWVSRRGEATAFGVGKPQAAATKVGFEGTIFHNQGRDDLLLVTLEPAGDHGNEHRQDRGVSSGWRRRHGCVVQYTPNLSDFNGVSSAVYFNHTGCTDQHPP